MCGVRYQATIARLCDSRKRVRWVAKTQTCCCRRAADTTRVGATAIGIWAVRRGPSFQPPPPPKHPQIPFLFSPFGGYIKARRETIENTTILVVPQDPEAKTNKRVKPLPGDSLQLVTTPFPPLHDIIFLQLWSEILELNLPKQPEPIVPCKHTSYKEMVYGFWLLVTKRALVRVIKPPLLKPISYLTYL